MNTTSGILVGIVCGACLAVGVGAIAKISDHEARLLRLEKRVDMFHHPMPHGPEECPGMMPQHRPEFGPEARPFKPMPRPQAPQDKPMPPHKPQDKMPMPKPQDKMPPKPQDKMPQPKKDMKPEVK